MQYSMGHYYNYKWLLYNVLFLRMVCVSWKDDLEMKKTKISFCDRNNLDKRQTFDIKKR